MKLSKIVFFFLLIFEILFISLSGLKSQNGSVYMQDRFYLGTFNFFFERNLRVPFQLAMYDSLRYNAMQNYCAHIDSIPYYFGKSFDAGFFDSLIYYRPFTDSVLDDWVSVTGQPAPHSMLFEREKVLRPAYGQRSTYQAESNPYPIVPYYFYSIHETGRDSIDPIYNINGRCCNKQAGDIAGFIVENLIENGEQVNKSTLIDSNSNSSSASLISDVKKQNYKYKWFVKPRMRIDAQYAMNNRDTLVARIEIISKSGDVKALDIKCLNFLDNNYYYDGNYMEMFNQMDSTSGDYKLFAPALWLTNYTADDTTSYKNAFNHIDYRVYWYGKVNTWLDYVRVDDEWAHYLFTDSLENEPTNTKNPWKFHMKIKEEVETFGSNNAFGYFWVDEMGFNNIPCLAEVNRLVKKYSNNQTSLVPAYCTGCFVGINGFKTNYYEICNIEQITHDYLKSSGAISGLFVNEMYPFYNDVLYPSNLNITTTTQNEFPATTHYQKAVDNTIYDSSLSATLNGWSLFLFRRSVNWSKDYPYPFSYAIQVHADEGPLLYSYNYFWREPTNEEICMQNYLALAYGAKQIYQYCYHSQLLGTLSGGNNYFCWGLSSLNSNFQFDGIREYNYFGQKKFDGVKKMNKKIKAVGDFLYPSGSIQNHFSCIDTRTLDNWNQPTWTSLPGLPYLYLDSIISFSHPLNSTNYNIQDYYHKRFFEIGFFSDPLHTDCKYFLVTNKSCAPELSSNGYDTLSGDSKKVKFKFIANQLSGFNNWKLMDAVKDSLLITFNKDSNQYIDGGIFEPGEGRLLKLVPVMKDGGTFVCNELVGGSFNCDSIVYNDGYNLTVNAGSSISFSTKGKIVMRSGSFYSGLNPSSPLTSEYKGNGVQWEGISFEECTEIQIDNSVFKDISYTSQGWGTPPQNCALYLQNCMDFYINNSSFYLAKPSDGINLLFSYNANPVWGDAVIYNCTFYISENSPTGIVATSVASMVTPLRIGNNKFYSTSSGNPSAIMLTEVSGGALESNFIHKFKESIILLESDVDVFNNYIYSDKTESIGIKGLSTSYMNLSPNLNLRTGGSNKITTPNIAISLLKKP